MEHSVPPSPPNSSCLPTTGRLLGVDFGTKRVGLAISTADQSIASPLEIYSRCNDAVDARHFKTILEDYNVRGIVVGLPIHVNGTEGQKAKEARAYGKWLAGISKLPVDFHDERYTSAVADDYMLEANLTREQRKKRVDMIAAQILLQSFLDRRQPPATSTPISEE
ncbi:Holliday junction resolvase RuvX [Planctomicrobium sp. SH661]|uniref:Holliday junction resolvase RuvX n=1 Tax=Planctomicrobium sp. SH661 TaxID=3448124 RepID=UPI003F5C23FC